ncbi:MAG: hypothetical protein AAF577_03625 [Pseudomonadota bacterium]
MPDDEAIDTNAPMAGAPVGPIMRELDTSEVAAAPALSVTASDLRIAEQRESVREKLAMRMLLVFGSLCIGIVVVYAAFVLVLGFVEVSDAQITAIDRMLTLLTSSLLPAVVGIFGSVIGYYFGSQQKGG